jgi:hypothetical protein
MDELITTSGQNIDLDDKVPFPLNLSIADFREPDKRQRNFSKEIDLPGTANNYKFFETACNLTKIGGSYDFNSSAKVNCSYFKNGSRIMPNAVLKLNKVITLDKKITFKVGLYSDFVDTFLLLSNVDVRELDWSAYTHVLNNTNITASFYTPLGEGYHYPLIEKNQRPVLTKWKNTDLVPYVHLVDVFKKCMELAGQKFTSNFIGTTRAKSILYGYGGGNYIDTALSPTEQENRKVLLTDGTMDFSQNLMIETTDPGGPTLVGGNMYYNTFSLSAPLITTGLPVLTLTETQDIYSQHSPNTFTAQRTGNYKLSITGEIKMEYIGTFDYVSGGGALLYYQKNGVSVPMLNLVQDGADQDFSINIAVNLQLNQGDEVTLLFGSSVLTYENGEVGTNLVRRIRTTIPLDISYTSLDLSVVEGSTIEIGRFLPSMKCSEFISGFLKMFKLMVSDPDIYGVIRIEPEVNFYQGTNVFTDISEEVDESREIETIPSANEYAKTLTYAYKTGTETDAKDYISKWTNSYGNLTFDQPSFFAKGEQKLELPFATIIPYQIYPGVIVPRFVDIDSNGVRKPTAGVPRVMFRNGMKTGSWQLEGVASTYSLASYPAVHHFDDFEDPTFDLNFKLVEELMYATNVVTTKNLYSEYYYRFVNEIINREGKYVILYRKMNNSQIQNLDWSKLLMWNGALFRLNKILDFDSEVTEVTKIEMIKVLEARSPRRFQITVPPGLFGGSIVLKSPRDSVGEGLPLIHGGNNQVLETRNIMKG